MSEISEIKLELEKVQAELKAHQIMLSSLMTYVLNPADRMAFIKIMTNAEKDLNPEQLEEITRKIGHFSGLVVHTSKYK
ncbi:hypothetical protein [Serratia fonticola]|uniref:hypothetical protein n=1 Tax=Serratia fonticola TaxID=47917 RepID=UPI00301C4FB6